MLWLAAIPCIEFMSSKRAQLPLFPLIATTYWIYYARPIFAETGIEVQHQLMPTMLVTRAAQEATIGLAAIVFAYYALPRGIVKTVGVRMHFDVAEKQRALANAAPLALVARILPSLFTIPSALSQLVIVVATLGLSALGGLFIGWLRGEINARSRGFLVGFVPLMLLLELGTGSVANPIKLLLFFFLLYVRERGRIPWVPMILSAALMFPFMTTKHVFRQQAWTGEKASLGPVERGFYFISLTYDLISSGDVKNDEMTETAKSRLTHLGTLAWVMQMTPGTVPYWGGDTYVGFFWTFVPRIIYPDKPNKTLGSDFGHRYGLLDSADIGTSYNFEQLTEAYANFGESGVIIVSLIAGFFYRMACGALDHEKGGIGAVLLLATCALTLSNIESDFSLVFGGVFYSVIAIMVGMRFLTGGVGQRAKTE
jgi:hypothetical protein